MSVEQYHFELHNLASWSTHSASSIAPMRNFTRPINDIYKINIIRTLDDWTTTCSYAKHTVTIRPTVIKSSKQSQSRKSRSKTTSMLVSNIVTQQ